VVSSKTSVNVWYAGQMAWNRTSILTIRRLGERIQWSRIRWIRWIDQISTTVKLSKPWF
jgi:hypothetical protein